MRVLGVDPGLQVTGYGVLDNKSGKPELVEAGVIRSTSAYHFEQRLFELYNGIENVICNTFHNSFSYIGSDFCSGCKHCFVYFDKALVWCYFYIFVI